MEYNNYHYEDKKKVIVEDKAPKKRNSLSVISLVFGVVSFVVCWAVVFPVIIGIIGLVTGIISLVQGREGHKMAMGVVITSSIGLVCGIIVTLMFVLLSLF